MIIYILGYQMEMVLVGNMFYKMEPIQKILMVLIHLMNTLDILLTLIEMV